MMIDWPRVEELHLEIGTADFAEVVVLFLTEVEDMLYQLTPDTLRVEDLHFLKGSALNLGFTSFAALCREGERLISAGEENPIGPPHLVESYELSKQEFLGGVARYLQAA